jgi:hypothetical protein
MKLSNQQKWLFCDEILSYFGSKNDKHRISHYNCFINDGVDDDLLKKISSKKTRCILGSDGFVESIAIKIIPQDTNEIPDQNQLIKLLQPSLSTIQRVTCGYFQIDREQLTKPNQNLGNLPRRVAIYFAVKNTDYSHPVIANFFGNTGRYGVSQTYRRLLKDQEKDQSLSKIIKEIERELLG